MKRTGGRLKEFIQEVLPGLAIESRPQRIHVPKFQRNLSSAGPIGGLMPIFDLKTGAEIMSVVDEGANVTIYYENMDSDGHPQQLLPRQVTRQEYFQMLKTQPRLSRKRSVHQ